MPGRNFLSHFLRSFFLKFLMSQPASKHLLSPNSEHQVSTFVHFLNAPNFLPSIESCHVTAIAHCKHGGGVNHELDIVEIQSVDPGAPRILHIERIGGLRGDRRARRSEVSLASTSNSSLEPTNKELPALDVLRAPANQTRGLKDHLQSQKQDHMSLRTYTLAEPLPLTYIMLMMLTLSQRYPMHDLLDSQCYL